MKNNTYPNTVLAFLILKKYKLTFAETKRLLFDEKSSGALIIREFVQRIADQFRTQHMLALFKL